MQELLLGIDIGTSSTKAILATRDGAVVATAVRPHETAMPRPGWFEHDPEAVWWADVCAVSRELLAKQDARDVASVCVSGIGPCLLVADESGRPLRPAILYGVDTRARNQIEELRERYGNESILKRGGSPLTSQAIGPKLLWIAENEPEVWAKSRRMFMASSYAIWQLTGEYVLDHHSASQCDPMYELAENRWTEDWAPELAGNVELPRLSWPGDLVGHVGAQGERETGIAVGTPVAAGTIDAWSEAVSVGARDPGDVMLMYGTTMFIVSSTTSPVIDEHLWSTTGCFRDSWSLAAGMATSGSLTAWARDLTGAEYSTLFNEAAAVEYGANGLLVLPYFAGERTPLFDPDARGTILGLTLNHTRAHLFRALLEATAYGVRHNLETMAEAGASLRRLVAVGGGTAGDLWPQIVSDVTGSPQVVPEVTVGAAYGDAYFAGVAAGLVEPSARWERTSHRVEPDPSRAARYEELFALYRELYPATGAINHKLAGIQRES